MQKRKSSAPGIVFLPGWKALMIGLSVGLGLNGIVVFFVWLGRMLTNNPPGFLPPTVWDIIPGSGFLLIPFWMRWAWQPRRKHARWHQWLATLITTMYINGLLLWAAIGSWNHALNYPWSQVVNGVLSALFILVWTMPIFCYPVAKKLSQIPWILSGPMMGLAGIAGILGASFGMHTHRHGETRLAFVVMGFLISFIVLMISVGGARSLWDSRPWAKEGDE